jgi:hypothetical protein
MLHGRSPTVGVRASLAATPSPNMDICHVLNCQRSAARTCEGRRWPPWPAAVGAARWPCCKPICRFSVLQPLASTASRGLRQGGGRLRGGGACALCLFIFPSASRAVARPMRDHLYTTAQTVSSPVLEILASRCDQTSCDKRLGPWPRCQDSATVMPPKYRVFARGFVAAAGENGTGLILDGSGEDDIMLPCRELHELLPEA